MGQFPGGLPYADSAQRIHSASRELSVARKEMMNAHTRLNEFIEQGIVPEDLKRSSTVYKAVGPGRNAGSGLT